MYFETLAMNSGRLTGTCTCHQVTASEVVAEMGGIQSDMETDRGGNVSPAEALHDLRGPTTDEKATGGGAGAGRGGPPTNTKRTNAHPDSVAGGISEQK